MTRMNYRRSEQMSAGKASGRDSYGSCGSTRTGRLGWDGRWPFSIRHLVARGGGVERERKRKGDEREREGEKERETETERDRDRKREREWWWACSRVELRDEVSH